MKQKLLIIGNGLLGSRISNYFSREGVQVACAGRRWEKQSDQPFHKIHFDESNLVETLEALSRVKPSHSIVAIGKSSIQECKRSVQATRRINVDLTLQLLEFLERIGSQTLTFSSSLIWDSEQQSLIGESITINTEYGRQKKSLEENIHKKNLRTRIVRLGKVINKDVPIVKKVNSVYRHEKQEIFYKNLFLSPVHEKSIFEIVNLWLFKDIERNTNLVPNKQWSEVDIVRAIVDKLDTRYFREGLLSIEKDELPNHVNCPISEAISPLGIYGIDAVKLEVG